MLKITRLFLKSKEFILANKHILFYVLSFLFFYINSSYISYPDEFSNLLGGKLMLQGLVPYKDFFDHHMPFGWLLSAFILLFSFGSYTLFRFWWATLAFVALSILAIWIKKNYREFYYPVLIYLILYPLMGVYFWFHLVLADSLAALFISLVFWILIVQSLTKKIDKKALMVASILIAAIVFSSLTYIYLIGILYLWILYLFVYDNRSIKEAGKIIGIFFIPYVIFLLYLLFTNSLWDFYNANVLYNTQHYISIPNYVSGRFFNPIKFALALIYNFYNNYIPLLSQIKHLDLYFPIITLSGLSTLTLFILLIRKYPTTAVLYFFFLSFSSPRSDIQKVSETNYQMSAFIVIGVMSSIISLFLIRKYPPKERLFSDLARLVQVIIFIFLLFSSIFLLNNTYSKYFLRYTQKMPYIINYTFTSDFLNDIVKRGDYYWIGPFHPEDMFFVRNGRLPGKYFFLMPQFSEDDFYKQDFIKQFEANPPQFIVYPREDSIFMTPAIEFGAFFLDWVDNRYIQLKDIPEVEIIKNPSSIKLRDDIFILKSQKDELLGRLKDVGYIK